MPEQQIDIDTLDVREKSCFNEKSLWTTFDMFSYVCIQNSFRWNKTSGFQIWYISRTVPLFKECTV